MAGRRSLSDSPIRVDRRARSRSPPKKFRSRSPRNRGGEQGGRKSRGQECRVFVSNLPFETRWMELKDVMKKEGKVVHVEILTNADGRPKGLGVVEYSSPDEAQRAIEELNDYEFQGRKLRLREDQMSDANYEKMLRQLKERSRNSNRDNERPSQRGSAQSSFDSGLGGSGGGAAVAGLQQLIQLLGDKRNNSNSPVDGLASLLSSGGNQSNASAISALAGLGALGGGLGNLLSGSLGSSLPSSASPPDRSSYRGMGGGNRGNVSPRREPRRRDGGNNFSRPDRNEGGRSAPGCQVFVRNLPFSVRWQDLKDRFKQAGRVTRADVMLTDDGRSKGFGTVAFEIPEDADRAISLFDGSRIDGREIQVRIDRK